MECHVLAAAEREKCGGRQSRASEKDRWTNLKFDGSRDGKWEKESVRNIFTRSWKCAQIHSLPLLSRRYVGFHALVISSILLKERRERERERELRMKAFAIPDLRAFVVKHPWIQGIVALATIHIWGADFTERSEYFWHRIHQYLSAVNAFDSQ